MKPLTPAEPGQPSAAAVEQAIRWYVLLASGEETERDEADFMHWRGAHPDHEHAWLRLQSMNGTFRLPKSSVSAQIARTVLNRSEVLVRRRTLKTLAWFAGVGVSAYCVQEQPTVRERIAMLGADASSGIGEIRAMQLDDGTRLLLNTRTAIDIRFSASERRIVVRAGEIQVSSAADPLNRPLIVETDDGTMRPVGTRFTVQFEAGSMFGRRRGFTLLAVSEGTVEVSPQAYPADVRLVAAGQQLRLSRDMVRTAAQPLDMVAQSWTTGVLSAQGMRLQDLLEQVSRYHLGVLRCAPEVADLRITGTWPIAGNDLAQRVLASVERRLPVKVTHYTQYWTQVVSA